MKYALVPVENFQNIMEEYGFNNYYGNDFAQYFKLRKNDVTYELTAYTIDYTQKHAIQVEFAAYYKVYAEAAVNFRTTNCNTSTYTALQFAQRVQRELISQSIKVYTDY